MMPHFIASLKFYKTSEGGRETPLDGLSGQYRYMIPLLFNDIPELEDSWWSTIFHLKEYGKLIYPGDEIPQMSMTLLMPEHVMPYIEKSTTFQFREARIIGEGKVLEVLKSTYQGDCYL